MGVILGADGTRCTKADSFEGGRLNFVSDTAFDGTAPEKLERALAVVGVCCINAASFDVGFSTDVQSGFEKR